MILEIIKRISTSRSQKVSSAALTVAVFGFLSRIIGLWRDRILAGKFGAGETLDIYYAAFKLPDLVYNLLIVGAVSAAFLPVFHEYFARDKNEAWALANRVLNILLVALLGLSFILIIFTPQLIGLIAPGFDEGAKDLTASISRIMFLSIIFLGASAFVTTLLQAFSRFLITALAPIFYNLGIIFGVIFLVPGFGIRGLAYGVVLGAFFHLMLQLPAFYHLDFSWRPIFDLKHPGIKKIFTLWLPRTFGLLVMQLNSLVITAIASGLAVGSIAVFNLADNLRSVPSGIIGVAFSTAAFPALSLAFARSQKEIFLRRLSLVIRQTLFMVLPLSFLFFILRAQIVRLVLGTGQFSWQDTRLTAAALGLFAFGIFASALVPLLTRAFFAFQNTKTPVLINSVSMFINILLSFLFVGVLIRFPSLNQNLSGFLRVTDVEGVFILGLPLAVTLASIMNLIWLWRSLQKHLGNFSVPEIKRSFYKIFIASLIGAIVAYFGLKVFAAVLDTRTTFGLLLQTLGAFLAGGLVYLTIAFLLKTQEMLMLGFVSTLFNWRGTQNPQPEPVGETLDDQY